MTSFPLPKMSDVIGPICSGYVPFRTVKTWRPLFLFSGRWLFFFLYRGCVIDWHVRMSENSVNPAYEINSRLKRKIHGVFWTTVWGGNRTRIAELVGGRSPSVLAGPGPFDSYEPAISWIRWKESELCLDDSNKPVEHYERSLDRLQFASAS